MLGAIILSRTPERHLSKADPVPDFVCDAAFCRTRLFYRLGTARSSGQRQDYGDRRGYRIYPSTDYRHLRRIFWGRAEHYDDGGVQYYRGVRDIHEINGIKTASAVIVNGVALIIFISQGLIIWHIAIWMGIGAVIGGYVAARISKRINQNVLRWTVITIGLIVSVVLFLRG